MPPELDNMEPEMDQPMDQEQDMGAEMPSPESDREGAMAKAELIKLATYAQNLQEHIDDDEQLEAWVQAKITIAATNIASVYHYMAYEKKIGEYGDAIENTPMSESRRDFMKARLVEAKAKVKELKKVHAEKLKEEKSSTGGEITRTKTGLRHSHNPARFTDEPHAEPASKAKAQSASDKAGDKAADKAEEKEGKAWEKQHGKGSVTRVKDGKKVAEGSVEVQFDKEGKRTGLKHTSTHKYSDEPHAEPASKVKARSAADKAGEKAADKAADRESKSYEKAHPGTVKRYKDGKQVSEATKAKKDYDQDGKIESGKDEYLGSKIRAAKKAGKLKECGAGCTCEKCQAMKEASPSAGLSKAKKSAVVKKAKAGGDIGKPGKGFDKLAKKAGGGEKGEKIAAAAMWKNIKETTAYVEAKKNLPGKQEKLDVDKDGKLEKSDFAALRAGKKEKETVKESADLTRMKQFLTRLNG